MKRKLVYRDLDKVVEADLNPKDHDDEGIEASLARFEFVEPIVEDGRTKKLIAGHGRLAALRRLRDAGGEMPPGITSVKGKWFVPVLVGWRSKNDDEARAYLVASNRLSELGGWNHAELLRIAEGQGPDLLKSIGLRLAEVEQLRKLAEVPDSVRAAAQRPVPGPPIGLREAILHLSLDEHAEFQRNLNRLRRRWKEEVTATIVLRALREATS